MQVFPTLDVIRRREKSRERYRERMAADAAYRERGRQRNRENYARNVEKRKAYQLVYRANHPDKITDRDRCYYRANAEKIKARARKYTCENLVRCVARATAWAKANPDKRVAIRRKYKLVNRERIVERRRERYLTEPCFRLRKLLGTRVRQALRVVSAKKAERTMELTGCTIGFLKGYIEARFKKGMTWGNQSEWHIDHIIPVSRFNLIDPEQQKRAFNYTNLQPLWGIENLRKSAKCPLIYQPELV